MPLVAVGVSIASKVTIFPLVSITTSFVAKEDIAGRINREALEDEDTKKILAKKNEMKELTLEDVVLENLEEGLNTIGEMKDLTQEEGIDKMI
ncbi:Protein DETOXIFICATION 43 [Camellia lanceoleosa]|uniref:Protein DETOXIFICATION 43 n=1 Tax=Camellia lanceoleosa TaxID=1840588 RepID=A0ACC0J2L0_9ERIC|nr:Protein DETOXIFICATION 43 [Camellia lanceoleosa]